MTPHDIAQETDPKAKAKYAEWYDQHAQDRSLKETVLMLSPIGRSKLETCYSGPYVILQTVSPTTYEISTSDRG